MYDIDAICVIRAVQISRADRFLAVAAAWKLTSPDERSVYASQAAKLWEDQQSASA